LKKIVAVPVASLWAKPSRTSVVVSQSLYGWAVDALEKKGSFWLCASEEGYQGWVAARHLADEILPEGPRVKLKYAATHLYATPSVSRKAPLLTLPFEVELPILQEEDQRWIQVAILGRKKGWIQREDVWSPAPHFQMEDVLHISRQFIGLPYTWGGRSSFGYDCSGFVQMVFRQLGICLPRDARQQIDAPECSEIAWGDKKRGDLLFFGSASHSITHVALYLGENELIHASAKPVPRLQTYTVGYYEQTFKFFSARRVRF